MCIHFKDSIAFVINSKPSHGLGFPTIFSSLLHLPYLLVLPVFQAHRPTFLVPQTPSCPRAWHMPFPLLIRLSPRTTRFTSWWQLPFQFSVHLPLLWNPGWFPGEVRSSCLAVSSCWWPLTSQHFSSYPCVLVGMIIGLLISSLDCSSVEGGSCLVVITMIPQHVA